MSLWLHISAWPRPSVGRQRLPTHPSPVGKFQISLDAPTHRLDKRPRYFTPFLQVFQAQLLRYMDEAGPDPTAFRELRRWTDLALCATKTMAQAIGRSMASLVVLKRHLCLMLMEIKDTDKVPFLDLPVSPTGLFGPSVERFAERFTAAQKLSQAMRHFLPKRSRSAQTPQPAKTAPPATQPEPKPAPRDRSHSARCRSPPKGNVFIAVTGPIQAPKQLAAAIADIIKHKHSQKESRFPLPHNTSGPSLHGDKLLEAIQPLVTRAEAW